MADTLERRVTHLEDTLARVLRALSAGFASLDVRLAELRELLLLQNNADKIEARGTKLDDLTRKVDVQAGKLDEILARLPKP